MPVVFLITIVAVLVCIFFAATGRGGEMAYEQADQAPLDLGPVSAADVALLRPPTALWGYNMQVTDAALDQVARAMRERDITIAYLQEQVASFERNGSFTEYAEPMGVQARQAAGLASAPGIPGLPEAPAGAETLQSPQPYHAFDVSSPDDTLDDLQPAEMSEGAETSDAPEYVGFLDDFLRMETPEAAEPEAFQPAESGPESQPAESGPESQPAESPAAETHESPAAETEQAQEPPRTPLILKASPPHEATQPSETLQDPGSYETTQPSEIYDPTQPSDEAHGPQGDFNAHDWWAEQREAARQEETGPPAGTGEGQEDGTAEERGW